MEGLTPGTALLRSNITLGQLVTAVSSTSLVHQLSRGLFNFAQIWYTLRSHDTGNS